MSKPVDATLPPHAALPRGPMLVGFSGGLDSTVLLHRLAALPAARTQGLRAIHVHHGLHADADAWEAQCRQTCAALGVDFVPVRVAVERDAGDGPEAAARRARHAAFHQALGAGEVLALAHHRDDQAETFLLRALRGSGPDGLGAMRAWRRFGRGWLWRPLLDTPRAALLPYAQAHGLRWVDDASNHDVSLDRNFLRHQILPLLRERWPQAEAALARSARLQLDTATLLEAGDAAALAAAATADPQVLQVAPLRGMPSARRARVLRRWIATLGLPPLPAAGIARIESDLLHAAADAEAQFAWHGAAIRCWRDLLHAGRVTPRLPDGFDTAWDGAQSLVLPSGDRLALIGANPLSFDTPLRVHARRGGERIVLPGRSHSHALKHVLQELGVPPWERQRLPLLSNAQGELLAAGDLAYSAAFDAWLRERSARLSLERAPDHAFAAAGT